VRSAQRTRVPNLDDALVDLELRPVHDALRQLLEPGAVRLFADLAEHPGAVSFGKDRKIERERAKLFEQAWLRCGIFIGAAQTAYASRRVKEDEPIPKAGPEETETLAAAFRQRLRAAMRMPAVEALFPVPWTAAARRMLPSPSPQFTATAMWGPILGWCALELLAESIDAENPERAAWIYLTGYVFASLLRRPLAHSDLKAKKVGASLPGSRLCCSPSPESARGMRRRLKPGLAGIRKLLPRKPAWLRYRWDLKLRLLPPGPWSMRAQGLRFRRRCGSIQMCAGCAACMRWKVMRT